MSTAAADIADIGAGCGCDISHAREVGITSLYDPDGPDFMLCMPCYDAQEAILENDTNVQPEMLARYYATFGLERPKLYDVIKGEYA